MKSLYALLEHECGVELANTRATLDVTAANPHEADLLQVEAGAPLFHMRGKVRDTAGRVVEFFSVLYRGDRLRFKAESE